jgi:hypothetical protein
MNILEKSPGAMESAGWRGRPECKPRGPCTREVRRPEEEKVTGVGKIAQIGSFGVQS